MKPPITNVHCHIFTDRHTPDDFLATRWKNRSLAIRVKNAIRNSPIATGTIAFASFVANLLKGGETDGNGQGLTRMLQVATLTKQAECGSAHLNTLPNGIFMSPLQGFTT